MAAGVPGTFRGVASMFFSVIKKRYVTLAAPLLLFSIACTSEDGTTPTTAEPADTPTLVAPTAAPTSDPSPPSARPTATPASGPSNQLGPTPTPTATPTLQDQLLQELLYARATATALTPTPTITTPTPTPTMSPPPTTPMVVPPAEFGSRVGDLAPDFTLTEISTGQPVQLAELTAQGRPVVLYFFTTW